jgi:hypothetical protein
MNIMLQIMGDIKNTTFSRDFWKEKMIRKIWT